MEENSASPALNSGPLIMAGLYDDIIKLIGAFKLLMGGCIGQIHPAIIVSVAYGFAPTPTLPDR